MQSSLCPDRFRILSGSALKLIAAVTMLIDHASLLLAPEFSAWTEPIFSLLGKEITVYYILRKIGRLAFPIYCFLIGEGFVHTGNRLRYLMRLLFFAVVSEIPFNLLVSGKFFYAPRQNVFFTLFLGALFLTILECEKEALKQFVGMLAVAIVARCLKVDYGLPGAALILLIYYFRSLPALQAILSFPLLSGGVAAFAAFIPIQMYNGQRGFIRSAPVKYFFYLFYPLHMLVLVLVKLWVRGQ